MRQVGIGPDGCRSEHRISAPTIDLADRALVRLVLAGAPVHWLWNRIENLDLEDSRRPDPIEMRLLEAKASFAPEGRRRRRRLKRLITEVRQELARCLRAFRRRWSA